MNKKKAFIIVLVLTLTCIFLAGCGNSELGSNNTHAKELGIGEAITADSKLTMEQIREYSNAAYLLEHYKSVECSVYAECAIDGTVLSDQLFEFKKKNGEISMDMKRDKTATCEHDINELNLGDFLLDNQYEDDGCIIAVFKAGMIDRMGYQTIEYKLDKDSCLTISTHTETFLDNQLIVVSDSLCGYNK